MPSRASPPAGTPFFGAGHITCGPFAGCPLPTAPRQGQSSWCSLFYPQHSATCQAHSRHLMCTVVTTSQGLCFCPHTLS